MKPLHTILAFSIISFISCKSETKIEEPQNMETIDFNYVKTVPIEQNTEESQINTIGIVSSASEAKPSFKTGGIIHKTYVKENDFVHKGQLLATLVMDEIYAQVSQAEEGLIKAERDLQRTRKLFSDSVATLEQMQNVNSVYEMAKQSVQIARFNRTYSEVRAPISGKIVKQLMRTGEVTGPGNPIYAIIGTENNDWLIKAGLIDRDWARVKLNDAVVIKLDAFPGKSVYGYVSNKSSVGGNTSGTFDVDIKFKVPPGPLAAGLVAKISILSNETNADKVIPVEALVQPNGKSAFVFTVSNGKAKKIRVSIAKLIGDKVAINHGLEGITEVITIGAMYLEDGDLIKVQ